MPGEERPVSAVEQFVEEFGELVRAALEAESSKEPEFRRLLREHLGAEPRDLPVIADEVSVWDHVNLQLAIEALVAKDGRSASLVGIGGGQKRFMALSLSDLVNERHFRRGSVEYENRASGAGRTHPCMLFGLVLLRGDEGPAVLLVRRSDVHGPGQGLQVEAMAPDEEVAGRLLAELRGLMRDLNVFRGQMVSFEQKLWGGVDVVFHERPGVPRTEVILPEELLESIERHTVGISRRRRELQAAGRHLKRGLLLHGPPGTGKTHTVKWIATELARSTVIVLSGGSLGAAGAVSRLARELAPSVVVLEDVDLIAEERTMMGPGAGPVLFELLNELDGMGDDADVAVVLTTNRPDLLEPALAARPGRVDLAVEVPLPDPPSRERLWQLYARGVPLELERPEEIVRRTEGVTASFFRELVRQAVLEAAERGSDIVCDEDAATALDRLLAAAGAMTRILLGAAPPGEAPAPLAASRGWLPAPSQLVVESRRLG